MSERSFEDELRLASRGGDAAAAPSASGAALTAGLNLEEMVAGSEAAFSALLSVRPPRPLRGRTCAWAVRAEGACVCWQSSKRTRVAVV